MAGDAQHVIVAVVDDATGWIAEVRRRYDPIAALVPAHVTLVYPFDGAVEPGVVGGHLASALAGIPAFPIALDGVSGSTGNYLRYDIKQGNDVLIAMHDQLYTGPLAGYLDITESYQPHVTIGRLADPVQWRAALHEVAATVPRTVVVVRRVISYRRYGDGTRRVDTTVDL